MANRGSITLGELEGKLSIAIVVNVTGESVSPD
jgi:hypothetical protein